MTTIFVSYSHLDRKWCDPQAAYPLIPWLENALRRDGVTLWYDRSDDAGILPGAPFRDAILNAIDGAQVALLLVSEAFFASDFIRDVELPRILDRAKADDLVVIPILLEPCDWQSFEYVASRQMLPGEPTPLINFTGSDREWVNARDQVLSGIRRRLRERTPEKPVPPPPTPVPPPGAPQGRAWAPIVVLAVAALAIVAGAGWGLSRGRSAPTEPSAVAASPALAPVTSMPALTPAEREAVSATAPGGPTPTASSLAGGATDTAAAPIITSTTAPSTVAPATAATVTSLATARAVSAPWADPFAPKRVLDQGGTQVGWSPDGALLAIADRGIALYDTRSWELARTVGSGPADGFAFSPDGKTLAAIMGDVRLFDVSTGAELRTLPGTRISTSAASGYFLAFSPDGKALAVIIDEVVKFFDAATGEEINVLPTQGSYAVAWSPDGKTLATAGWSNGFSTWDLASGESTWTPADTSLGADRILYAPGGAALAGTMVGKGAILLWEAGSTPQLRTFEGHTGAINSLGFSADGKLLASASDDVTARIWDVASGHELQKLIGHSTGVEGVAFSPDGATLATTARDGTTRLWSRTPAGAAPTAPLAMAGPVATVTAVPLSAQAINVENAGRLERSQSLDVGGKQVGWSPDGALLAIAGHNLSLIDANGLKPLPSPVGSYVNGFAFSPDGKMLAVLPDKVKLYDAASGAELRTLDGTDTNSSAASGYYMAWSPDGRTLAVIVDEVIKLFDAASGQQTGTIISQGSYAVDWSPDGKTLATAGWGNGVATWDLASGQQAWKPADSAMGADRILYAPDGSLLATARVQEGAVTLYEASSGRLLRTLQGHKDTVNSLAFSPDGKLLATASNDVTAKVWDLATGKELKTLVGHSQGVESVAFSPDGATLATTSYGGSGGGTTLLWTVGQ
jgi:WD40 repeat protein